jgi:hypothetical protein
VFVEKPLKCSPKLLATVIINQWEKIAQSKQSPNGQKTAQSKQSPNGQKNAQSKVTQKAKHAQSGHPLREPSLCPTHKKPAKLFSSIISEKSEHAKVGI